MTSIASRVWVQRWSKSPPINSVSSLSQPVPMPKTNRPPLTRSKTAISLAKRRGFRSGTNVIPVHNLMVLVTPDARARAMYGSVKWE